MKNKTDITIILDRSGSMEVIKRATITGFNSFIKEQRNTDGKIRLSLVQFDHEYKKVYEGVDIEAVPLLNSETYEPRGTTALLDAIGRTIVSTKERHSRMYDGKKDPRVIFVIITDGHENASTEYRREYIMKKIRKAEDKDNWQFVYLGANQDAIHEAQGLGISYQKAMTYAHDKKGINEVMYSLSENLIDADKDDFDFKFTDEQRNEQKREKQ